MVPGDIHTPRISIVEGAKVSGEVKMDVNGCTERRRGFPQELINRPKLWKISNFVREIHRPEIAEVRTKLARMLSPCCPDGAALRAPAARRRNARRAHHARHYRRRRLELRRLRRTPADPRLARPGRSATSRPGRPPSRTRRSGPTPPRATTSSSPTASSSRTPAERVSAQYPKTVFIVTSGARAPGQCRAPHLPARGGELPGRDGGRRPDQEQRPGLRRRDRAPADQGRVRGLGQRGQGGQPEGPEPRDLPQQLRRRGGRAGGGAGPDPGRAPTCSTTTPMPPRSACSRRPRSPPGSTSSAPTPTSPRSRPTGWSGARSSTCHAPFSWSPRR